MKLREKKGLSISPSNFAVQLPPRLNTRTADGVILISKAKKFVANFLPIDLAHKKFLTFSEIW